MSRRSARERAFQLLYQLDLNQEDRDWQIADFLARVEAQAIEDQEDPRWPEVLEPEDRVWVERVVRAIEHGRDALDAELGQRLRGWTVARLPRVDRALLRLATWEILHEDDTPNAAIISEAVVLARRYAARDARPYINAVLGRLAGMKEAEVEAAAAAAVADAADDDVELIDEDGAQDGAAPPATTEDAGDTDETALS